MSTADAAVLISAISALVIAIVRLIRLHSQRRADRLKIEELEEHLKRGRVNRLAQLERYVDASLRWRRELREWLIKYAEEGAIDMNRIDMTTMPLPPDQPISED